MAEEKSSDDKDSDWSDIYDCSDDDPDFTLKDGESLTYVSDSEMSDEIPFQDNFPALSPVESPLKTPDKTD